MSYHFLVLYALVTLCASWELTANLRLLDEPSATVSLELTNNAEYSVALLRWQLPLDHRFESPSFHIRLNGNQVPYIGAIVKFAPPEMEDYVFFEANETKSYMVVLANAYDFSQPGSYDVIFVKDVLDYETEGDFESLPHLNGFVPLSGIVSNSLQITTTTSLAQKILRAPYPCTASEISQINTASSVSKTMIGKALAEINRGQTALYSEWFGAYTVSRYNDAKYVIDAVAKNTIVKNNCDSDSPYAYVYPADREHNIYFCRAFWTAPTVGGYDTKAGTIIHELSHFNDIGQTNDWVYGTTGARDLARSNPTRAIANADNYEYYSESQCRTAC